MSLRLTALAAVVIAAMSSAAFAQTTEEIQRFNGYLDSHPGVAEQLAANPSLANDSRFLANHVSLQNFLTNHPGVRASLQRAPGQFVNREGRYEWANGGGPIAAAPGTAAGAVTRCDEGYLDEHPEVARELGQNPRLADNPQFLATHPVLDSYPGGASGRTEPVAVASTSFHDR